MTLNKYYRDDKANKAVNDKSFNSEVQILRTTGANYFLKFMRSQVKQIEDILKESSNNFITINDKLEKKESRFSPSYICYLDFNNNLDFYSLAYNRI